MKIALALCFFTLCAVCRAEERKTQSVGVVQASASDIWEQFQTDEGIRKVWGVAKAKVDFRQGGKILTNYDPKGEIGDENTITNEIIAYEPERVLILRSTAPEAAPDFIKTICETGWTVVRLTPLTSNTTEVTITGLGFKDGPLYDQAFDFFQEGNAQGLAILQNAFESKDRRDRATKTAAALKSLVGTWEFSQPGSDGSTFKGRTTIAPLFGGNVLFGTGFLGNEKKLVQHSHLTIAKDPRTDQWTFWNFADDGSITAGACTLEGDNKLVVDWDTTMKDGKRIGFLVEYTLIDHDNFDLLVQGPKEKDGTRGKIANVHYKRVSTPDTQTPLPAK